MTRIRRLKKVRTTAEYCTMMHTHQLRLDIVYSKDLNSIEWKIMYWTKQYKLKTIYSYSLHRGLELAIMLTNSKIV